MIQSSVRNSRTSTFKAGLYFIGSAIFALYCYSLGWSGGWHFDDMANLGNLLAVFGNGYLDTDAAEDFVFSGHAGPLGRPLALASFLIDGSTWPVSPRSLLYTNSLLHLLNAFLLCGFFISLLRQHDKHIPAPQWVAVVACSLWLIQPILVSSSLMTVQRMTLLSSTFMLMGAWLFVLGHKRLETNPLAGWLLVLSGVSGGTLLGVFSKEQAGLLPLLLWLISSLILPKPRLSANQQKFWFSFKLFCFYLPAAFISFYLLRIVINADAAYSYRNYSLEERLWTQSVILWDYLRLVLVPQASAFGPFHDDYPILKAGISTAIASLSWLGLLLFFWLIRKTTSWPLFALLWYFICHLVESTVVPLELYFEHRNYLAISGPILVCVLLLKHWSLNSKLKQRIASSTLFAYCALVAFSLWQTTLMFGQPLLAANIWHQQHPLSARASQHYSSELINHGLIKQALDNLDNAQPVYPLNAQISLQRFQLACFLGEPVDSLDTRYKELLRTVNVSDRSYPLNDSLTKLNSILHSKGCNDFLDTEKIISIANAAIANRHYQSDAMELSNLHYLLGMFYLERRDLGNTMLHLEKAMHALPQLETLEIMVGVLSSAGLRQEALLLFDEFKLNWPKNPILREKQQQKWYELKKQLTP